MIIQLLLLFLLLSLLFFISQKISLNLYKFFYILSANKKFSLVSLAFIFLPGTIIHELSHFLLCSLLRVKTGALSVFPKIGEDGEVKAGSLMMEKTDPFRHTLIGLAPIIIGLTLIYLIGKYLLPSFNIYLFNPNLKSFFFLFAIFYLLFTVSSTMFSSRKDLESAVYTLPVIFLFFLSLQTIGVRIFFEEKLIRVIEKFLYDLNIYLVVSLVINLIIHFILHLIFLTGKHFRRRDRVISLNSKLVCSLIFGVFKYLS